MIKSMPAPSPILSSLSQRLSATSLSLLNGTGSLPTAPILSASVPDPSHLAATPVDSTPSSGEISDEEKLALFDQIIEEIQQSKPTAIPDEAALFASVTPQALPQATEALWQQAQLPTQPSPSGKERTGATWSLDSAVQESGGMLTAVETERQPEISAEVENYLQRVEDSQESPADELAKLIPQVASANDPLPTEVVRVLPVTKTIAAVGHTKSPKFSVRWLVEWSDKLVKIFQGKAVYRAPGTN